MIIFRYQSYKQQVTWFFDPMMAHPSKHDGWQGLAQPSGRVSDSRSTDPRFEPRQEHNKKNCEFFRVKNVMLTLQTAVCIHTHKNDHTRTLNTLTHAPAHACKQASTHTHTYCTYWLNKIDNMHYLHDGKFKQIIIVNAHQPNLISIKCMHPNKRKKEKNVHCRL